MTDFANAIGMRTINLVQFPAGARTAVVYVEQARGANLMLPVAPATRLKGQLFPR